MQVANSACLAGEERLLIHKDLISDAQDVFKWNAGDLLLYCRPSFCFALISKMLTGSDGATFNKGRNESQNDELMYKHRNHRLSLRLTKLVLFRFSCK